MRELELQLTTEYFPDDVEKLKDVYEKGDRDEVDRLVESITSTKVNVESVEASYPPLDFSTPKDVVIKVRYSLIDSSGTREEGTKYYLFKHGSLSNNWNYRWEVGAVSYYLNFF